VISEKETKPVCGKGLGKKKRNSPLAKSEKVRRIPRGDCVATRDKRQIVKKSFQQDRKFSTDVGAMISKKAAKGGGDIFLMCTGQERNYLRQG